MTDNHNKHLINMNSADLEGLTSVPGIGPALAERIIAARPFMSLDDLRKVPGIGSQSLERILPYITLEDINVPTDIPEEKNQPAVHEEFDQDTLLPEALTHDSVVDTSIDQEGSDKEIITDQDSSANSEAEKESGRVDKDELEEVEPSDDSVFETKDTNIPDIHESKTRDQPAEIHMDRGAQFRIVVISNLVTMVLTVFITLGILYKINQGSLQYAVPRDINQLNQNGASLDLRITTLENDQSALRTRLDNLDSMAGRLNELENISSETRNLASDSAAQVQMLSTQVMTITQQINAVSSQVDALNTQVDNLQANSDRFQQFLDGLESLLTNLPSKEK